MAENFSSGGLEAEIVELQKRIEEKRNQLEQAGNIVEERDLVRNVITESFTNAFKANANDDDEIKTPVKDFKAKPVNHSGSSISYLDTLDQNSVETVNSYLQAIPTDGIIKTIGRVRLESPYIIDAFHDSLVDKLFEELKSRGIIK